jgi:monoamine oxidase
VTDRIDTDVCVLGAGLAGLTAARRLDQGGREVVVVEARDRVGGRVRTITGSSGVAIDLGGTFIAPFHDRMHALADELGVATHQTFVEGDSILATGGKVQRYTGDVPKINPVALASAGQAIARLDAMAKKVPVDAPWDAPKAAHWDAQSIASWLSSARVPTATARDLLRATFSALFCCDPSEVSLLDALFLIRSAGGLTHLMTIEGGYQDAQLVGGAQSIPNAMAADLGDRVVLDAPVTTIRHGDDGVEVITASVIVSARHAIVALPPAIAGHIRFDPPLPADRALLFHSSPAGTEIKTVCVYGEPFWRKDGVSGASVAMDDDIEVTLDTSPADGSCGMLAGYAAGPKARRLAQLTPEERRDDALAMLCRRFGPRAGSPLEVHEQNWAEEEWNRGCSMAHWGTGVLTQYGRLLREPMGRVHWAGTETASVSHGAMDGAVRSGERAASEISSH